MGNESKYAPFGIFRATVQGWRFVARDNAYLARTSVSPLGVILACNLFVLYVRPDASVLEASLWGLPASVLMAWYSFIIVRRIVLGETIDALPESPIAKTARDDALRASVLISLLFNMGVTASSAGLDMVLQSGLIQKGNAVMMGLVVFTTIITLWSLRFGALALLAAVDYPLAPFLKQVQGFLFSLQLLGLGLLSIIPLVVISQLIVAPFVGNPLEPTSGEMLFIITFGAPLSLMIVAILTASTTFALKELLGKSRD